jgi:hypothetical protein
MKANALQRQTSKIRNINMPRRFDENAEFPVFRMCAESLTAARD